MEILNFLIPLALLLAAFFVIGFIWMTKKGQYDDLETPALRMLLEDELKKPLNHSPKGDS
jgi:cbb3-type cytochrome oxidase maturation protein